MKKWIVLFLLVALPVFAGDINPDDLLSNWIVVGIQSCPSGHPHFHALVQNPDPNASIKFAELILNISFDQDGNIQRVGLIAYSYKKDEVKYVFAYDGEKFVQVEPNKSAGI